MSDKPKPGGYIDNAALNRALRCNQQLVARTRVLLQEGDVMSRTERYRHLQWLGLELAEQRDALAEMERIRSDVQARRANGALLQNQAGEQL